MATIDKDDHSSWAPKVNKALDVPAFNYGECMKECNCFDIAAVKAGGGGFISQYVCLGDRKKTIKEVKDEEE